MTGRNYDYFFEQYFQKTELPQLSVFLTSIDGQTTAVYQWNSEIKDFHMPIKITTARDHYAFIYPTTEPQNISLGSLAHLKILRLQRSPERKKSKYR